MKKFLVPLLLTMLLVVGISAADQTFNFMENRFYLPNPSAITSVSANYTALATDHMIKVNATSGPITITLPGIVSNPNADSFIIQKTDSTLNPVIVKASTTDSFGTTNTIESKAQRYLAVAGYMSIVGRQGYNWIVNWETSPIVTDMSGGNPVSIMSPGVGNSFVSNVTVSTTFTAADCGKTISVLTDALTFTLPAASTNIGCKMTFVNTGAAGNNIITIKTNGSSAMYGTTFSGNAGQTIPNIITAFTGSSLNNTKSTAKQGDLVELVSVSSATWIITKGTGTWATI